MFPLFFSLFLVFVPNAEPLSTSELSKIVYVKSEDRVDYFFEKPTWENVHSIGLEKGTENLVLTFRQKGKVTYQLRLVDNKKIQIKRSKFWEDFNPEKQYLKKEQRIQYEDLIGGPQFSFSGGRMTSSKIGNPGKSLAIILDAMDSGSQAQDDGCTQSGTCSCGETSISVTCPCNLVIYCRERTVRVCDYDMDTGEEINCEYVTGCSGSCR